MTYSDDPLVRAAMDADANRFPPNAEFEVWCFLSAWALEEATALSMGIDPHIISRKIINAYGLTPHPHFVETAQDALHLSPRAAMYEDRLRHLERACEAGEVENVRQVGDTWEVRPLDFLAWFERHVERHGERYPWNGLHPLFVRQVRKDHPAPSNASAAVNTAPCGAKDTEKEQPGVSSLGVSRAKKRKGGLSTLDALKDKKGRPIKEKKGVLETWELMCSVLKTPLTKRKFCKFPSMKALKNHCEAEFGISFHDCVIVVRAANKEPRSIPYPAGAPRKSKAA